MLKLLSEGLNKMGFWDFSKKKVGIIDVKTVKTTIERLIIIKNHYLIIQKELTTLSNVSIKNANEIRNLPSVLPAVFGGTINQKYGDIVQIFNVAKNGDTINEIIEILKFIDNLVNWLVQVSTITDETKLNEVFHSDNGVSSFALSFRKFTEAVTKINLDVGNSIAKDDLLITEENILIGSYRNVDKILKSLSRIPQTCVLEVRNFYIEELQKLIVTKLNANRDINSLNVVIRNIGFFNDYIIENFLKFYDDVKMVSYNKEFISKFILKLSEYKDALNSFDDVKKHIFGGTTFQMSYTMNKDDKEFYDNFKKRIVALYRLSLDLSNESLKAGDHRRYMEFFNIFMSEFEKFYNLNKIYHKYVPLYTIPYQEKYIKGIIRLLMKWKENGESYSSEELETLKKYILNFYKFNIDSE